jgi:hypothetical protein
MANNEASNRHAAALEYAERGETAMMLRTLVPEKADVKYYSVTDICLMLGMSADKTSKDRKRITTIVSKAYTAGTHEIIKAGVSYKVPADAIGPLFGEVMGSGKHSPKTGFNPAPMQESGSDPVENLLMLRRFPTNDGAANG